MSFLKSPQILLDLCQTTWAPRGFPGCLTFFQEVQPWKLAREGAVLVCEDQWGALSSVPGTGRNPPYSHVTSPIQQLCKKKKHSRFMHQIPAVTERGVSAFAQTLPSEMWCDSLASATSDKSFVHPLSAVGSAHSDVR